jgi:hypothetical protein
MWLAQFVVGVRELAAVQVEGEMVEGVGLGLEVESQAH